MVMLAEPRRETRLFSAEKARRENFYFPRKCAGLRAAKSKSCLGLRASCTTNRIRLEYFSEDPIGFAAGDANLYRYVGNSPTNFTDPTGLISWSHSVEQAPNLDGELGYSAKIRQVVNADAGQPAATAPRGTQTWQINYAEYFIVVTNGTTSRAFTRKQTILDVNDIGGKRTPMRITDTVSLGIAGLPKDQEVVLLIEKVTKRLGFRPYDDNFNPTGKPLKVGNGRPLQPGEAEILRNMKGPMLSADTLYIYVDKDACRTATKEHLKAAQEFAKKAGGSLAGLPAHGSYEEYTYGDLGSWFAFSGPQTSDP